MILGRILLFSAGFMLVPQATADVFRCADAEGRVTYTNDRSTARNCQRLRTDLPVTNLPSSSTNRPATAAGNLPSSSSNRPATASTNPSFPRVSADAQRSRDDARRRILEQELANEEAALAEVHALLATQDPQDAETGTQDRIELHERNINAIRREISNLR